MDDAIEYSVGECGLADDLVPRADRQLAGDEGRGIAVSVLDDLQEIAALVGAEPFRPLIIEDQQVGPDESAEEAGEAAVAAPELQFGEEPGHALVEDGMVPPAGHLSERAGEPAFADAAGTDDDQVALDPLAGGELLEERAVEASGSAVVDVLDGGLAVAELGVLEPVLQATVVALGDLAVEQQGEPFGVVELVGLGLAAHLVEGLGHAGEAEFAQLVACRVVEHLI